MSSSGALALMRAIREADIGPPVRKLVAFVLASYANVDGGGIRPGLKTVARLCGRDLRTVRRHVSVLQEQGVLVQTEPPRRHEPAVYKMDLETLLDQTPVPALDDQDRISVSALESLDRTPASHRPDTSGHKTGHHAPPTCIELKQPGARRAANGRGRARAVDRTRHLMAFESSGEWSPSWGSKPNTDEIAAFRKRTRGGNDSKPD